LTFEWLARNFSRSDCLKAAVLPSSKTFRKLTLILENQEYMAMMKEKVKELKRVYRGLKLTPQGIG